MSENVVKYGLISWDEPSGKTFDKENRTPYMKLQNGDNKLRFITGAYKYQSHDNFKFNPDEKGFGDSVRCAGSGCPCCALGSKATERYLAGVIDRVSKTYKILDFKWGVFKAIQDLNNDESWGAPVKYDINIKVDKQQKGKGYYTPTPIPHKALSAEDLELKNAVDLDELKNKCTPPTPEDVQKRLDFIKNKKSRNGTQQNTSQASSSPMPVEEGDMDFPAVN